jgi:hypothetical protein
MTVDINWIQAVAGLVIGFLLKVLFDELKYAKLRILGVSITPFTISPEIQVSGTGFDNYYTAYRIRVENKQKRYLNCAAENCIAWLELDSAPEPYQICWVGSCPDVTINVGDVREVDFCARGNTTGTIYAPTERGYFESLPRQIGDGKSELRGKLRITSKNGKREEKRFIIKPNNNQLEISILDKYQKENREANGNTSIQEPLSFKPLPWGILFFSFWAFLFTVDTSTLLIRGMAWFSLGLSGILLLSIFITPFIPRLREKRLYQIMTNRNVRLFFVVLVFFITLLGFPLNTIQSWSKLEGIYRNISIVALVLWVVAYLLVLISIAARMERFGQIIGGIISAVILWRGIDAFCSDKLAGIILLLIGIISIVIVIKKPNFGQLPSMI